MKCDRRVADHPWWNIVLNLFLAFLPKNRVALTLSVRKQNYREQDESKDQVKGEVK